MSAFPDVSDGLRSAIRDKNPFAAGMSATKLGSAIGGMGFAHGPCGNGPGLAPGFVCAMLDFVDHLRLRRGIARDDCSLAFPRIDGNPRSKVIYFLPLQTSFSVTRQVGFLPLDFLAAYEMPNAIASSEPDLCLQAMLALADEAQQLLNDHHVAAEDAVIVGLSAGGYPATYLANRIGARLCSIASADRIDLLIWESPATRIVRRRASQKGYIISHYTSTLEGPAQNLRGLAPHSLFVVGRRDPFIPTGRMNGLLAAVEAHAPCCHVVKLAAGHVDDDVERTPSTVLVGSDGALPCLAFVGSGRVAIGSCPAGRAGIPRSGRASCRRPGKLKLPVAGCHCAGTSPARFRLRSSSLAVATRKAFPLGVEVPCEPPRAALRPNWPLGLRWEIADRAEQECPTDPRHTRPG